ncbi:MAG: CBS domain-containing protein [Planctomycetota bacterium]|jgi:CBS domain-containing protein
MKVRDLVDCTSLVTAAPTSSLGDVCDIMKENHISGLPVIGDSGQLEGLISIGQVLHFAHDGAERPKLLDPDWHSPVFSQPARGAWRVMNVKEAMIKDVITVSAEDEIEAAAKCLFGAGVHRAVVLDGDGRPAGMLTSMDFTRFVANSTD